MNIPVLESREGENEIYQNKVAIVLDSFVVRVANPCFFQNKEIGAFSQYKVFREMTGIFFQNKVWIVPPK